MKDANKLGDGTNGELNSKIRNSSNSQNDMNTGDFDDFNDPHMYGARESDMSGNPSKMKLNSTNFGNLEKETAEQLRERLACCICLNEVRSIMI